MLSPKTSTPPLGTMKSHLSHLTRYGLILVCLLSLPSCSGLACLVDNNKLHQLDLDYHAGKVSRRHYKRERARLVREIRENAEMFNQVVAGTYTPPAGDDGEQVVDDGGGEVVVYDAQSNHHGGNHTDRRVGGMGQQQTRTAAAHAYATHPVQNNAAAANTGHVVQNNVAPAQAQKTKAAENNKK